ncbi:pentapeptide repeat-containing protein [Massilia sp. DJPM01]|uniref:pentapeptide repeat-containing protein n=1 Tax=Massilia sp. DJPM01 TaxID=3024404 RepID=UPI00259E782E|nr:pentapeptide repeat-containing protein [Massilia sp. DJPM01]MDM5182262.1 pentapeptide repeat-containing protein [Massilia sp. DJPM01]
MSDLISRWVDDAFFQLVRSMLLDSTIQPDGMSVREWYVNVAPKAAHPVDGESLDCRAMNIDGLKILDESFGYVLDGSSARGCTFEGTNFQGASAEGCDFTGSRFLHAQMSPFYAPEAVFKNCTFDVCFLMGIGLDIDQLGSFSDLRGCDFTDCIASKVYFERCNMQQIRFENSYFSQCTFCHSDVTGMGFSGARFENCDFSGTRLDDVPLLRRLVKSGNNRGIDMIEWCAIHK